MFKKFYIITTPVILFLLQNSFLPAAPSFFQHANIILVYCVLLLLISNVNFSLYNALLLGLLMDIYSPNLFGANIFSLLAAVFLSYIFFRQFFTDKSVYTFIFLISIATIFFNIFYSAIVFVANFITVEFDFAEFFAKRFFLGIFYSIVLNNILTALAFYVVSYFSTRLKPFLIKINR
ncbi:hypothetical protein COT95_01035 [Candidatus Falkowbacteria bacterium CG10_big_fil_rev_8_21_14_0_10_37_6]|uniref:Rod shape-determining protein MreD n=1 Tax=Candidatus Falkowbacteria bacterium CG10_big_fil_rev_8_21_14_0_10_37_6 TaxID=1974563 RepID=A0A2H0V9F3_9BACT|nr:MAG: hypothetical protein COT95_01035 [Candidatus Falkowbacteria bacterium CG10_big_fil_rev_8_21_14_0_10_37_6]